MDEASSRPWQLATLLLPVFLTGWLTFAVSRAETRVKQEFDIKNQQLSAQLSLSTELFKRRFDAYETLYAKLIEVQEKLGMQEAESIGLQKQKNAKALATTNRQTADLLAELDKLNQENALHVSDGVYSLTTDAWKAGVDGNTDLLKAKMDQVEKLIKSELKAEMVTQPPGSGGSNPAASP